MSFNIQALPPRLQDTFYEAVDFNVVYWAARQSSISDQNKLTDLLFYHAHKELVYPGGSMPLKPGMANYNALVAEWRKFKQIVQSLAHGQPNKPSSSSGPSEASQDFLDDLDIEYEDLIFGKPAEGWTSHALSKKIQDAWGREVAAYCRKPPASDGRPSAGSFDVPKSVSSHVGHAIVWKARNPRDHCRHGAGRSHYKIMVLGLLRYDRDYWLGQTGNNPRQAGILSETARVTVWDYRRCVVTHQMCPHAAYQKLLSSSRDVIYEMFIGMFQLMSPQGASPVPGKMSAMGKSLGNPGASQVTATSSVPNYVNQIVSFIED